MNDSCQDLDCLAGVKVVDFTQFEAGPSCTELWPGSAPRSSRSRTRRRRSRPAPRPAGSDDDPWYFHQFNANKKSLTLNLKSPRGLEHRQGAAEEGRRHGREHGAGHDGAPRARLRRGEEGQPRHHLLPVKGFGTGSPHEKSLAFDMIAQAAGGPISVTGYGDRPPVKPGPSFGDTGTGMLMAISILGSLYERRAPARDAGWRSRCRTR